MDTNTNTAQKTNIHFNLPIYTNDSSLPCHYGRAHELMMALIDHKDELERKIKEEIAGLPDETEVSQLAVWFDSLSLTFDTMSDLYWGLLNSLGGPAKKQTAK